MNNDGISDITEENIAEKRQCNTAVTDLDPGSGALLIPDLDPG
jgi:hypothetical protein